MPDIKHQFTGGKMNKDLDERLVPNGEYRDAVNIQVSTSESGGVGTVQNIAGNFLTNSVPLSNAVCVGSVDDERNDSIYWFVTETAGSLGAVNNAHITNLRDLILRYNSKTTGFDYIFVDTRQQVIPILHFQDSTHNFYLPNTVDTTSLLLGSEVDYYLDTYGNMHGATGETIDVIAGDIIHFDTLSINNSINVTHVVLKPTTEAVLEFDHYNLITGINIIDDLLFWTDGITEPKKINIERCHQATSQGGQIDTWLYNPETELYSPFKKPNITVIKPPPKNPLELTPSVRRDDGGSYSGVMRVSIDPLYASNTTTIIDSSMGPVLDFSSLNAGDWFITEIETDINDNTSFSLDWVVGEQVVLKQYNEQDEAPPVPLTDYVIKCEILSDGSNNFDSSNGPVSVKLKIESISGFPPEGELRYLVDRFDDEERMFEHKFPRFSYRYKYTDGEYSTYAPFSRVAFVPGTFDYHPKKGYNLGMTNRLTELTLTGFMDSLPSDVIEVDILYKEDSSTSIYLVDSLRKSFNPNSGFAENSWDSNSITLTKETVRGVLPMNQLLRGYDNVPRNAKAQEIVGNRIVYANYLQNYTLKAGDGTDYYPDVNLTYYTAPIPNGRALKSVKSLREYQIGVVFIDKHGRETPVLTNPSATSTIPKTNSGFQNNFAVSFNGQDYPKGMDGFKVFIKETSGEYYSLAMDRFYDAEDGNLWIAFPQADRNKITEDSVLILKKGSDSDEPVHDLEKYKVLAISGHAPDYVKTVGIHIVQEKHMSASNNVLGDDIFLGPRLGAITFKLPYARFKASTGARLDEREKLWMSFSKADGETSQKYKILAIDRDDDYYSIKLEHSLQVDMAFITDDPTGINSNTYVDGSFVNFFEDKVENSPRFDGRFFVKIFRDSSIVEYLKPTVPSLSSDFEVTQARKVWLMDDQKFFEQAHLYMLWTAHDAEPNWLAGWNFYDWSNGWPTYNMTNSHYGHNVADYYTRMRAWSGHFHITVKQGYSATNDPTHTIQEYEIDNWPSGVSLLDNLYYPHDEPKLDPSYWYIDKGYYYDKSWGNGLDDIHNDLGVNGGQTSGNMGGITPTHMNLTYGGVRSLGYGGGGIIGFDEDAMNVGYTPATSLEKLMVEALVPGTTFRWRQDPHNTIYTVGPSVSWRNLMRYGFNSNNCNDHIWHSTDFQMNSCPFSLPSNLAKNYHLPIDKPMVWDPSVSSDFIPNGLSIPLTVTADTGVAASSGGTAPYQNFYIMVDTLIGTCNTMGVDKPITVGMGLRSIGGTDLVRPLYVKNIDTDNGKYRIYLCGVKQELRAFEISNVNTLGLTWESELVFEQLSMNGWTPSLVENHHWQRENSNNIYLENSVANNGWDILNLQNNYVGLNNHLENPDNNALVRAVGYDLEIVQPVVPEDIMPDDPAVFETEPDQPIDLNIYYEATSFIPTTLNVENYSSIFSLGGVVSDSGGVTTTVSEIVDYNIIALSTGGLNAGAGDTINIHRDNNELLQLVVENSWYDGGVLHIKLDDSIYSSSTVVLDWFNCYSFGNGVESNRIRDTFNEPYISNGVKVSATLAEPYREEERKSGLIYSGIYNSTSGVNNLNQFIQAEKITKDINPTYGSIQKLYTRNSDLVAFCEDKVLKILANKDALYNADGNPQLTATNNVLGQAVPFVGDFGISSNPESFARDAYRAYFTDKQRGTVMRLSMDGLTPISEHGMRDWFRDNLKLEGRLVGSFDKYANEYNLTLPHNHKSVSFREDIKGWVSFKSFVPEQGVSVSGRYYSIKNGELWLHNYEFGDRNTFYGNFLSSSLSVILNDGPGVVKTFRGLNYEGTQSKIIKPLNDSGGDINDGEYYNLYDKEGWSVEKIHTNLEAGTINEFIEKEGKWFNYIKGAQVTSNLDNFVSGGYDPSDFAIQGLGINAGSSTWAGGDCTDPVANNYNAAALWDDGSCNYDVEGCTNSEAANYDPTATIDDGSCLLYGCPDESMFNYDPAATLDDGSCVQFVYGCTILGMFNTNYYANTPCNDNGTDNDCCIPIEYGCTDGTADNYDAGANVDDGMCSYSGCFNVESCNWDTNATIDDGSCLYCGNGTGGNNFGVLNSDGASCNDYCIYCDAIANLTVTQITETEITIAFSEPDAISDGDAVNAEYSVAATGSDGIMFNFYINASNSSGMGTGVVAFTLDGLNDDVTYTIVVETFCTSTTDGSVAIGLVDSTLTDPAAFIDSANTQVIVTATTDLTLVYGCTDGDGTSDPNYGVTSFSYGAEGWAACNYDPLANTDDGSCVYTCNGCTDMNYTMSCDDCWDSAGMIVTSSGGDPWVYSMDGIAYCGPLINEGCMLDGAINYDVGFNWACCSCNAPTYNINGVANDCCLPYVYGCLDTTTNVYGNIATSNYAGPGSGVSPQATTACNATNEGDENMDGGADEGNGECCNPYTCPQIFMNTNSTGSIITFRLLNGQTPYSFANMYWQYTVPFLGGGSVSPLITTGVNYSVWQGNDYWTGRYFQVTTADIISTAGGYDNNTINISTNYVTISPGAVGTCADSVTTTFTIGCTDSEADTYDVNYQLSDDSACEYTGCTDNDSCSGGNPYSADNFSLSAVVPCNDNGADNDCCIYAEPYIHFWQGSNTDDIEVRYNTNNTAYSSASGGTLKIGNGSNIISYTLPVSTGIGCADTNVHTITGAQVIAGLDGANVNISTTQVGIDFSGTTTLGNPPDVTKTKYASYSVGCKTPGNCAYDVNAYFHNSSFCVATIDGCTDPAAVNYDPAATQDCSSVCTFGGGNDYSCCCYPTPDTPPITFIQSANIVYQQSLFWRVYAYNSISHIDPCFSHIGVYIALVTEGGPNTLDESSILWSTYNNNATTTTNYAMDISSFNPQSGATYDVWICVRNEVNGAVLVIQDGYDQQQVAPY